VAAATAVAPPAVEVARIAPSVAPPEAGAVNDAERAPRKRRRRRGGRPVEAGEGFSVLDVAASAAGVTAPAPAPAARRATTQVVANRPAAPQPAAGAAIMPEPGLLGRIGRGLKSLVKRAPRSQH